MARYIDVEPLEDKLKEHIKKTESELMLGALSTFLRLLDITPTADTVPVTRCKDCKWYVRSMIKQDGTLDERYKPDWCDLYRKVREETYFCADGERKDDE